MAGRRIGLHTLRHTLATWAADRGVPVRKIQRLLGLDDPKTTRKYAKHQRGYLREATNLGSLMIADGSLNGSDRRLLNKDKIPGTL